MFSLQYFTNEKYEAERYDKLLAKYEVDALKTTTSLAMLNWGQNAIFSAGLTVVMFLASQSIMEGECTPCRTFNRTTVCQVLRCATQSECTQCGLVRTKVYNIRLVYTFYFINTRHNRR